MGLMLNRTAVGLTRPSSGERSRAKKRLDGRLKGGHDGQKDVMTF